MMDINYPKGATPLDPNEIAGLIPTHITTREELDRWEQENINEALTWLSNRRAKDILTERFIKQLHKKMFGNVWRWSGQFRQSQKNIGVPYYKISIDLKQLRDDVEYWIANKIFPEDEMAVRFHHRLVSIHLFPNGNGRHARLMADLLLETILDKPRFSWGNANLVKAGNDRTRYIEVLYAADKGNYEPLLKFARS